MKISKVVFRADGDIEIGYGHFVRMLGLAGIINSEFECSYATVAPTDYQINEMGKVCNEIFSLSKENHYEEFLSNLYGDEIVVIDDYSYKKDYQLAIRDKGCKLIYIDDHNDKHYVCDILINNIPGFCESDFRRESYTKLFLGIDYALLRKEFFNPILRKIPGVKNSIFICFGGSDVFNISKKIIEYLFDFNNELKINLLIGDAYNKYLYDENRNITIFRNLSAEEVALLMAKSEICIVPASSLLNEAASIGKKVLSGYFASNQIAPYQYFVDNQMIVGVDDYRSLQKTVFISKLKELKNSDFLITNQQKMYHYQQFDNLLNIFRNAWRT